MNDETQEYDWSNTYLLKLSDRVRELEDGRKEIAKLVRKLRDEAEGAGIRWDAFMMAHKIRIKLTTEDQLAWHRTFAQTAEQLSLFVE